MAIQGIGHGIYDTLMLMMQSFAGVGPIPGLQYAHNSENKWLDLKELELLNRAQ